MQRKGKNILAMFMAMLMLILAPITSAQRSDLTTTASAATKETKTVTTANSVKISKAVAKTVMPRISVSKLTLVEGESQQLKVVSGSAWNLKKVTTTNKKNVGIYGKNPAKKTVMAKGKAAGSETVKMHLEMKKSAWKKYKKILKSRKVTLKCKVKVVPKEEPEEEPDPEQQPEEQPEIQEPLEKYDISQWKPDKIVFTYNGKKQRPTLLGLPDEVKVLYSSEGEIAAGKYFIKISFEVPENYEPIEPIVIEYSIKPIEYPVTGGYVGSWGSSSGGSSVSKPIQKPEEKPNEPSQPEEKPSEPSQPEEEPNEPEHVCVFGNWTSKDNVDEHRVCSECGKEEIRKHSFQIKVSFENLDDTQHIVKKEYACDTCEITYEESINEAHRKTNWHYVGENLDSEECEDCDYAKTREHQHEAAPADLVYTFKSSNDDGTHVMETSYTCGLCREIIPLTKTEECNYEETRKMTDEMHNMRNIHIVLKDCKVCSYHLEEEESCVSDGITFYFRYLSQIYSAETCTICRYRCNQKPHFDHTFGEWTYYDKDNHRRECPCTDAREEETHQYGEYDAAVGGFYCPVCDHTELVAPHNHGHGFAGTWGDKYLMFDVVMNKDAYAELVDMSPIRNPNPSPEEYCSRLDFRCHTCGVPYSAYMRHEYKDGACVCGVVQPNSATLITAMVEQVTQAEVTSGGAIAA